jgi:hypothetical protein
MDSTPPPPNIQIKKHCYLVPPHSEYYLENLKGRRPLEESRRGRKKSIKMEVQYIGKEDVGWIHVTQGEDQWLVLNL